METQGRAEEFVSSASRVQKDEHNEVKLYTKLKQTGN